MTFAGSVRTCLTRRYATFSGRAARPEFWWFALFLLLGNILTGIVDDILFGVRYAQAPPGRMVTQASPLSAIFSLLTLVPSLAVGWRRMHDSGRPGYLVLYPAIVVIGLVVFASAANGLQAATGGLFDGAIGVLFMIGMVVLMLSPLIVIWWLAQPSVAGDNAYGPHPKEVTP